MCSFFTTTWYRFLKYSSDNITKLYLSPSLCIRLLLTIQCSPGDVILYTSKACSQESISDKMKMTITVHSVQGYFHYYRNQSLKLEENSNISHLVQYVPYLLRGSDQGCILWCPFSQLIAITHTMKISLMSPEGLHGSLTSPDPGHQRPDVALQVCFRRELRPDISHFKYTT